MEFLQRCSLRDLNKDTAKLMRIWRNQEHIRTMMFNQEHISQEKHEKWLTTLETNMNQIVKIFYFDENPMGVVTFSRIPICETIFEWGFYIGVKDAPKGMGTYLGITALDYYFEVLSQHKLVAEVLGYNQKSRAFHHKLGFKEEGILRYQYQLHNQYHHVHTYGLLKKEWLIQREILMKK